MVSMQLGTLYIDHVLIAIIKKKISSQFEMAHIIHQPALATVSSLTHARMHTQTRVRARTQTHTYTYTHTHPNACTNKAFFNFLAYLTTRSNPYFDWYEIICKQTHQLRYAHWSLHLAS